MTEFEMAYLLTDMQSALANEFAILFSLLFTFLGASFAAAHRLTTLMMALALSAYSILFVWITALITGLTYSLLGLRSHMHNYSLTGKGLQWHGSAVGAGLSTSTAYIVLATLIAIWVGSFVFFFHCRRVNQTPATQPAQIKPPAMPSPTSV